MGHPGRWSVLTFLALLSVIITLSPFSAHADTISPDCAALFGLPTNTMVVPSSYPWFKPQFCQVYLTLYQHLDQSQLGCTEGGPNPVDAKHAITGLSPSFALYVVALIQHFPQLKISSAYRRNACANAIRHVAANAGTPTDPHVQGCAVDLEFTGTSNNGTCSGLCAQVKQYTLQGNSGLNQPCVSSTPGAPAASAAAAAPFSLSYPLVHSANCDSAEWNHVQASNLTACQQDKVSGTPGVPLAPGTTPGNTQNKNLSICSNAPLLLAPTGTCGAALSQLNARSGATGAGSSQFMQLMMMQMMMSSMNSTVQTLQQNQTQAPTQTQTTSQTTSQPASSQTETNTNTSGGGNIQELLNALASSTAAQESSTSSATSSDGTGSLVPQNDLSVLLATTVPATASSSTSTVAIVLTTQPLNATNSVAISIATTSDLSQASSTPGFLGAIQSALSSLTSFISGLLGG